MKENSPQISVVIPVLNEEKYIKKVLTHIKKNARSGRILEILVVDGGSTDATVAIAISLGATVISSDRGRARQMNLGAKMAAGELLYFLHVDTIPPLNFDTDILNSYVNGFEAGCFRLQFDTSHPVLRFFAWCSRMNYQICRGGDQSLFISKNLFLRSGKFNESYIIYEDNEFIGRLYKLANFTIIPTAVKTSARRYRQKGIFTLQYHFGVVHLKHYLGTGPEALYSYYKKHIAV
ncbi:TIGR04283 family arsenosugar biosynthesis glycosyltransferase [Maribacter chungangensis]|uniref:TIGR04283 family arsenosugar biosynthesis glycosyltransferase n=1 Tax=Maribacter chungangensis TaxID=1069117 RepID=A0ABW3B7R2_9FLAO